MNKKLLSGLCAAVLLSGLVGCGPKEPKQDTTTSTSTNETENNTATTNNSEVTEKNFKDFPETDKKYFSYNDWNEGIVIEGCSSEEKVVVVPKEINGKPVLAIGERGLANMQNCEAVVLPDTVRVISKSAFTVDKAMKFVYLGTSLKKIDDLAFNGCSTEFEPSSKTIAGLVKIVKKNNTPVVLYIELNDGKVANTVAKEAGNGAKAMQIQTLHNVSLDDYKNGETYVSLMTRNLSVLKAALQ